MFWTCLLLCLCGLNILVDSLLMFNFFSQLLSLALIRHATNTSSRRIGQIGTHACIYIEKHVYTHTGRVRTGTHLSHHTDTIFRIPHYHHTQITHTHTHKDRYTHTHAHTAAERAIEGGALTEARKPRASKSKAHAGSSF